MRTYNLYIGAVLKHWAEIVGFKHEEATGNLKCIMRHNKNKALSGSTQLLVTNYKRLKQQ